ncbi:rCG23617, partial [Rattus norvegicus]
MLSTLNESSESPPTQQGGCYQSKTGQGLKETPGEESQVLISRKGEGQIQGRDDCEDAR